MVTIFRRWQLLLLCTMASPGAFAANVRLCTDLGAVDVDLDERAAPAHSANFLRYTESGFYSGTVFHRVVSDSMVQGGSYNLAFERRMANDPVANESGNSLSNRRGTIAAARTEDPDSATSQFFFNLSDNTHLDAGPGTLGYTVFGRVTAGLEVLDEISRLPTERVGDLENVPGQMVGIQSLMRLDRAPVFGLSIEPDPAAFAADFEMASARGDAAGILAALGTLRQSCIVLNAAQHLAEAEAAIALEQPQRARYGLEQYLATANALDRELPRAQRLYRELPEPDRSREVGELIGHCRRPIAPAVPNGRFAERATLQTVEGAVLRYRQLGQLYLTCVSQRINRGDLDETERLSTTMRHNEIVIELTAVAVRFNDAVRTFRAAQPINDPTAPDE